MGLYPPDSLIHEAQRRDTTILPPDVIHSDAECTVTTSGEIRIGLNYIKGVKAQDIETSAPRSHLPRPPRTSRSPRRRL